MAAQDVTELEYEKSLVSQPQTPAKADGTLVPSQQLEQASSMMSPPPFSDVWPVLRAAEVCPGVCCQVQLQEGAPEEATDHRGGQEEEKQAMG